MQCLLCHRQIREAWPLGSLILPQRKRISTTCAECLGTFHKIRLKTSCVGCGRHQGSKNLCQDCQKWQAKVNYHFVNHALYQYDATMKQYMHDYKFQGHYQLRHVFARVFSQFIAAQSKADYLVALPIDDQTWQTRGFNQVTGLLEDLQTTEILNMKRNADEKRQSQKKRHERLKTSNHFQIDVECPEQIKDKQILLLDDVYTTGRTLWHAAETLYAAGCRTVESITLCR
ncbi:ComF family protein [Pediococcus ethanolidurans]|uniref:ComF family protein n=1 Tax=Pediococcus ethanolidurans TaxID=319653 RepID=UPI0029553C43|nr:phosphoribosyltransferase family protein [Pediococcus ethanolidurans]